MIPLEFLNIKQVPAHRLPLPVNVPSTLKRIWAALTFVNSKSLSSHMIEAATPVFAIVSELPVPPMSCEHLRIVTSLAAVNLKPTTMKPPGVVTSNFTPSRIQVQATPLSRISRRSASRVPSLTVRSCISTLSANVITSALFW